MEVWWNELCPFNKTSEVGDHLFVNLDHSITCKIIGKAPAQTFKRKILVALKPTLNSQEDLKITHLLRNGTTLTPKSEILIINWFNIMH